MHVPAVSFWQPLCERGVTGRVRRLATWSSVSRFKEFPPPSLPPGGYVEVSAQLPGDDVTPGFWPAIWMMGNLARPGESQMSRRGRLPQGMSAGEGWCGQAHPLEVLGPTHLSHCRSCWGRCLESKAL